jgi:hypothetical protein
VNSARENGKRAVIRLRTCPIILKIPLEYTFSVKAGADDERKNNNSPTGKNITYISFLN